MNYNIIIGGGLTGLFIAKWLLKQGKKNIILVEKSNELGGVLKSEVFFNPLRDNQNWTFDFGIHFILTPENSELNDLILDDLDQSDYFKFTNSLKEGHVINSRLYDRSGCPNVNYLSSLEKNTIKSEIEKLVKENKSKKEYLSFDDNPNLNLFNYFNRKYGKSATKLIFDRYYEKFSGVKSKKLDITYKGIFAPERLILFNREKSKILKKEEDWNSRIAYADCEDSVSDIIKYYPIKGGIMKWVNDIKKNLLKSGVKILFNSEIKNIDVSKNKIESIYLNNEAKINCEKLFWTVPTFGLINLTKLDKKISKPILRKIKVVHLLIDKKPLSRSFWINFYDKEFIIYRAILYNNFAPDDKSLFRISVEIIQGEEETKKDIENIVFNELKDTNIIPKTSRKIWSVISKNNALIPILDNEEKEIIISQNKALEKEFKNLKLMGNRPDKKGGQIEISNQILNEIKDV